jgi:hypothetical protein
MRKLLIAAAVAIATLAGFAGYQQAQSDIEGWREIAWPFARDGWPAGRAFRCAVEWCGGGIEVYVRPKAGFCNCDSGVAHDDEVDRVADLDLMSERFAARAPGTVTRIAGMPGRLRTYDLEMADGSRQSAVGIAVSRRCDLLVAVAQGKGTAPDVQRVALDFLASREMTRWMVSAMEGSAGPTPHSLPQGSGK